MTTLAEEEPFAAVVKDDFLAVACSSCFEIKEDGRIVKCSKCKIISYCNKECQRKDLKNHEHECQFFQKSGKVPPYICRLICRIAMKLTRVDPKSQSFNGRKYEDLMDHREEIDADPVRLRIFDNINVILGDFMGEKFVPKREQLLSIYGRLNINYIDLTKTSKERRDHLSSHYYFECNCNRCTDPQDAMWEQSGFSGCCSDSISISMADSDDMKCLKCGKQSKLTKMEIALANEEVIASWNTITKEKTIDTLKVMKTYETYAKILSPYNLNLFKFAKHLLDFSMEKQNATLMIKYANAVLPVYEHYLTKGNPALSYGLQHIASAKLFAGLKLGKPDKTIVDLLQKEDGRISKCSKCKIISYCNKECQRNDLKNHEKECQFFQKSGKAPPYICRLICRIAMKLSRVDPKSQSFNGRKYEDLMDHREEIEADPVRLRIFDNINAILGDFMGEMFVPKREQLLSIYGRLNINYIDLTKTSKERRDHLSSHYYFECNCNRCTDPQDAIWEQSGFSGCCSDSISISVADSDDMKCLKCGKQSKLTKMEIALANEEVIASWNTITKEKTIDILKVMKTYETYAKILSPYNLNLFKFAKHLLDFSMEKQNATLMIKYANAVLPVYEHYLTKGNPALSYGLQHIASAKLFAGLKLGKPDKTIVDLLQKEDGRISKCSKCKIISYCNKECQRNDLKNHEKECQFFQKSGKAPPYICRLICRIAMKLSRVDPKSQSFNGRKYEDLMDHREEIEADPVRLRIFDNSNAILGDFMGEMFVPKREQLLSIYGRLNINYIDLTKTSKERRDHLSSHYYFECNCNRCTDPQDAIWEQSGFSGCCSDSISISVADSDDMKCLKCGKQSKLTKMEIALANEEVIASWNTITKEKTIDILKVMKTYETYAKILSPYNLNLFKFAKHLLDFSMEKQNATLMIKYANAVLPVYEHYLTKGNPALSYGLQHIASAKLFAGLKLGKPDKTIVDLLQKEDGRISKCSKCKIISYCNKECQRNDLKNHEKECQFFQKSGKAPPYICRLICRIAMKLSRVDPKSQSFNGRKYEDLMDHREEIEADPVRLRIFDNINAILGDFMGEMFVPKREQLLSIYGRLNINYIDLTKTSKERRDHLSSHYYFECNCNRCTDPQDAIWEQSGFSGCCSDSISISVADSDDMKCLKCGKQSKLTKMEIALANEEVIASWNTITKEKIIDILKVMKTYETYAKILSPYNLNLFKFTKHLLDFSMEKQNATLMIKYANAVLPVYEHYLTKGNPALSYGLQHIASAKLFAALKLGKPDKAIVDLLQKVKHEGIGVLQNLH